MKLPIISRFQPTVREEEKRRAKALAEQIRREQPQLDWEKDSFRNLVVTEPITDAPTLHLDDFSEIPVIGTMDNSRILQQRARLRAVEGDWVALAFPIERGYSEYCQQRLGLGKVQWLSLSDHRNNPRQLALECWQDRKVRHELIQAIRSKGLRYIHPHISTLHVWELAALLNNSARVPIHVIGPTPAMARWANDKIEFSRTAAQLLGTKLVPHTESAFNFATLAKKVMRLAASNERLCIKFPYGTGGQGNFVIPSAQLRGKSLFDVHIYLKTLLKNYRWPQTGRVLIDVWETNVLCSPSVQTWIPPLRIGEPIVEELFEQVITGESGNFIGSRPANLPASLEEKIIHDGYLLAYLFQQLGYVGRCSFDLILVGDDVENCHPEYIECNARWGGSSTPMTLANRLGVVENNQTYAVRTIDVKMLDQFEFASLWRFMDKTLYDHNNGQGNFILLNPARIKEQAGIDVMAIGGSAKEVSELLDTTLPALLNDFINRKPPSTSSLSEFLLGHADFDISNS